MKTTTKFYGKCTIFFMSMLSLLLIHCTRSKNVSENENEFTYDIVIYGGTSAAVIAAVEAVESEKSVALVSPDVHLGGLTSGGLGWTDVGAKETIGGLARNFYHRIYLKYQDPSAWEWEKRSEFGAQGQGTPAIDGDQKTMWIFEPHIAEEIYEDLVEEYDIDVYRDEWLDREDGVIKENGRIVSIETLSGKTFNGEIFIDATYEGDLMAAAGVSYHVGRESCNTYDEEWNGVQKEGVYHHGHYFENKIDPYKVPGDPSSGLLPKVTSTSIEGDCTGDEKVQAYCYRVCMTNHPDNRVAWPKPDNYDPDQYEILVRVFDAGWREWFHKFDAIPNKKTDTNNHGPFSSDNIGMNWDYPEASYERRREIIKEHEDYQKGLLYFVANDPRIPEEVQKEMQNWGLAADEFTDNGNWPHQLYIREARRMIGEYVMTENDVMGRRQIHDPVGMGSYTMDSHNVQRYVTEEGYLQNEGDVGVKPKNPYSISYRSLTPKKEECTNLLVPVCVSTSHIAFGSIRMEPVFMILGQSAAAAAALCIDHDIPVQELDYELLEDKLMNEKAILSLNK